LYVQNIRALRKLRSEPPESRPKEIPHTSSSQVTSTNQGVGEDKTIVTCPFNSGSTPCSSSFRVRGKQDLKLIQDHILKHFPGETFFLPQVRKISSVFNLDLDHNNCPLPYCTVSDIGSVGEGERQDLVVKHYQECHKQEAFLMALLQLKPASMLYKVVEPFIQAHTKNTIGRVLGINVVNKLKETKKVTTIGGFPTASIDSPLEKFVEVPKLIKKFEYLHKSKLDMKEFINSGFKTMNINLIQSIIHYVIKISDTEKGPLSVINFLEKHIRNIILSEDIGRGYRKIPIQQFHFFKYFKQVWWLLLEFKNYCKGNGTTIEECKPLNITIKVSQFHKKSNVKTADLLIFLNFIDQIHVKIDGETIKSNSKIKQYLRIIYSRAGPEGAPNIAVIEDQFKLFSNLQIGEKLSNKLIMNNSQSHASDAYFCCICNLGLKTYIDIVEHISRSAHNANAQEMIQNSQDRQQIICVACDVAFDGSQVRQHEHSKGDKDYKLKNAFKERKVYQYEHSKDGKLQNYSPMNIPRKVNNKDTTDSQSKTFLICKSCNRDFSDINKLWEHATTIHSRNEAGSVGCKICSFFLGSHDDEDGNTKDPAARLDLHLVSRKHLYHHYQFSTTGKVTDKRPALSKRCDLCDKSEIPSDETAEHVGRSRHKKNKIILELYSEFCDVRGTNPSSHDKTSDLDMFFQILYSIASVHEAPHSKQKRSSNPLAEAFTGIVMVGRIHDVPDDSVLNEMKDHFSMQSKLGPFSYFCYACNKGFKSYKETEEHLNAETHNKIANDLSAKRPNKTIQQMRCITCNYLFYDNELLNHGHQDEKKGKVGDYQHSLEDDNIIHVTTCDEINCNKNYENCTHLLYHMNHAHGKDPEEFVEKFSSTDGSIVCSFCSKIFINPLTFALHHDKHTNGFIQCSTCTLVYGNPYKYIRSDFCGSKNIPKKNKASVDKVVAKILDDYEQKLIDEKGENIWNINKHLEGESCSMKCGITLSEHLLMFPRMKKTRVSLWTKECDTASQAFKKEVLQDNQEQEDDKRRNSNDGAPDSITLTLTLTNDVTDLEDGVRNGHVATFQSENNSDIKPTVEDLNNDNAMDTSSDNDRKVSKAGLVSNHFHNTNSKKRRSSNSSDSSNFSKSSRLCSIQTSINDIKTMQIQSSKCTTNATADPTTMKTENGDNQHVQITSSRTIESEIEQGATQSEGDVGSDSNAEYPYTCLECEEERDLHCGPDCNHTGHSRVIIMEDLARHIASTGHTNIQSLADKSRCSLPSVALSSTFGNRVRKQWKLLVVAGQQTGNVKWKYEEIRKCSATNCSFTCEDAVKMFSHIRTQHLQ